jgi:hypothetical protein
MIFDNTGVLLDFLTALEPANRLLLRSFEVTTYVKATARNAFSVLSEATNLEKLKLSNGVVMEEDVEKAVKMFWSDASKLLTALGNAKEKTVVRVEEDEDSEGDDEDNSDDSDAEAEKTVTEVDAEAQKPVPDNDTTMTEAGNDNEDESSDITHGADNSVITKPIASDDVKESIEHKPKTTVAARPKTKAAPKPKYHDRPGKKSDAVDVLIFGNKAFQYKDSDKELIEWKEDMIEEFKELLGAKIK